MHSDVKSNRTERPTDEGSRRLRVVQQVLGQEGEDGASVGRHIMWDSDCRASPDDCWARREFSQLVSAREGGLSSCPATPNKDSSAASPQTETVTRVGFIKVEDADSATKILLFAVSSLPCLI